MERDHPCDQLQATAKVRVEHFLAAVMRLVMGLAGPDHPF